MKIESINQIIKNKTIDSLILTVFLLLNVVLLINIKIILSSFFPLFISLFPVFWFVFFSFAIVNLFFLLKNIIKIFNLLLLKYKYCIDSSNYVVYNMVFSSGFLYYMDNYKYKKININDIKTINKRMYCSILFARPHYFDGNYNYIPFFRNYDEYGDINYCLRIIDKNNIITFIKLKKDSSHSYLDHSFYDTLFNILLSINSQIEIGDDEIIKVHWNGLRFRKQSDFNVKDYLIVNDKVYDKWVIDFDKDNKNKKK